MDFLLSRWIKLDENLTIIEYWLKRDKVVVKLFNKVKNKFFILNYTVKE